MPIKLLVTRTTDTSTPDEYVFDQDVLTIGRDSSSHLTLPDLKRVVSKQHAELRFVNGAYEVTDLGSKNFTYINDDRLQSGTPYEVRYGDCIRIGDFEIRLEPVQAPAANLNATVFDVNFVNPFADDVARLAEALKNIRDSYEREAPTRREDALQEALQDAITDDAASGYGVVGQFLSASAPHTEPATRPEAPPRSESLRRPESPPRAPETSARRPETTPRAPEGPAAARKPIRPAPATGAGLDDVPPDRLETVFGVLLHAAARLVNIPWQFRHEFIGQTIMQSAESGAIYSGDADALKEYLLDVRASEEEAARRLDLLSQAAEDVAMHQIAMLDGYRAGAQEGTHRLLDEIDPAAAESEARQEGGLNRILAFRASEDALDRLKVKLQELQAEDWSVAERRIFRPAFIKAYLARMTSLRK